MVPSSTPPPNQHKLHTGLTRRYVLALVSTGCLLGLAHVTVQAGLGRHGGRLSASERFLRGRRTAERLARLSVERTPGPELEAQVVEFLAESQAALAELDRAYDARDHDTGERLGQARAALVAAVRSGRLDPSPGEEAAGYVAQMEAYLSAANARAAADFGRTRFTALTFFSLVILLLVAQGLFVFRPAVQAAREQYAQALAARDEAASALSHVKQLQGLIPICMHCRRLRDDQQTWKRLEDYLASKTDAALTHSLCDECLEKHYPEPAA